MIYARSEDGRGGLGVGEGDLSWRDGRNGISGLHYCPSNWKMQSPHLTWRGPQKVSTEGSGSTAIGTPNSVSGRGLAESPDVLLPQLPPPSCLPLHLRLPEPHMDEQSTCWVHWTPQASLHPVPTMAMGSSYCYCPHCLQAKNWKLSNVKAFPQRPTAGKRQSWEGAQVVPSIAPLWLF